MMAALGLTGKLALITGSASGIGEAIARRLAAEGARVVIHGLPAQRAAAEKIAGEIAAAGGEALVEMADLADPAACDGLIAAVVARLGGLDILVNNAAIIPRAQLDGTDAPFFDRAIAIDLRAPLLLIRAAAPHFRRRGGGRVLNIGSINCYCGEPNLLAYSIAKGGLATLTRNLADALSADRICINQINPGWVLTEHEYQSKVREGLSPDWPQKIPRSLAPAGRIFQPEEMAHFVAAFLAESAALVSGTVVDLEQFPLLGRNPAKSGGF
jgi:NAD(P)-dependent dehydrogenase (short-subunit alcohol dehydrogenase family)